MHAGPRPAKGTMPFKGHRRASVWFKISRNWERDTLIYKIRVLPVKVIGDIAGLSINRIRQILREQRKAAR